MRLRQEQLSPQLLTVLLLFSPSASEEGSQAPLGISSGSSTQTFPASPECPSKRNLCCAFSAIEKSLIACS